MYVPNPDPVPESGTGMMANCSGAKSVHNNASCRPCPFPTDHFWDSSRTLDSFSNLVDLRQEILQTRTRCLGKSTKPNGMDLE